MDEDKAKRRGRKQRQAPPEFKEIYIALMNGDMNRVQACRVLQCSNAQLNVWLLQHHLDIMQCRIDQLQEENQELRQSNKILQQQIIKMQINGGRL